MRNNCIFPVVVILLYQFFSLSIIIPGYQMLYQLTILAVILLINIEKYYNWRRGWWKVLDTCLGTWKCLTNKEEMIGLCTQREWSNSLWEIALRVKLERKLCL